MKAAALATFLILTGPAFAQTPEEWKTQRETVITNLEKILWKDRDKSAMVLALQILGDLKSKESVPLVLPLLQHKDSEIRATAAHLIAGMPTRESLVPLTEAVDSWGGSDSSLDHDLAQTLVVLDDPAALPALRRAVQRGVYGAVIGALGRLAERDDCELLIGILRDHSSQDAIEALRPLVARSNRSSEPWMNINDGKPATKEKWLNWWAANKDDFRVIKTATQAFPKASRITIVENADPVAELGVGTVDLPKGFVHRHLRGADSTVGQLVAGDGKLFIQYDIGRMAGVYARSIEQKDVVTSTTEKANGLTALIVVSNQHGEEVIISFPEGGPANFFARVHSDDQIEIVKKLALSFKLKPRESKK